MKKALIVGLCLILNLAGCSNNSNSYKADSSSADNKTSQSESKEVSNSSESKTTEENNKEKQDDSKNSTTKSTSNTTQSKETSSTSSSKAETKDTESKKATAVKSTVKLFDGAYFDDKVFGADTLKSYSEIMISNIKDTSFDFTVYEVTIGDDSKESKKVIFNTNTAYFTQDGTKAVFNGKNYTLNFSFPNNHNASPIVTDIEVSGFSKLENNTYVNNGIPGHEFG